MTAADPLAASYDRAPYESWAHPQTHPARLAALARLMGMRPAAVETCRVLEVGCAGGGNLLPMAVALPRATFLGIDLSERQIDDARRDAGALALANVDFRPLNLMDLGPDAGEFDFIIAHGVYSWMPPEPQERLLEICAQRLNPHGVAFISFNTLPGWFGRGMIREMLLLHARGTEDDIPARIHAARQMLAGMTEWFAGQSTPFAQLIRNELEGSKKWSDNYLLHEYLETYNAPLYFHQFVDRLTAHGLRYVCEADPATTAIEQFPPPVAQSIASVTRDFTELEQIVDVLRKRTLRQALLCRGEVTTDRAIDAGRMAGLHVAAPVRAGATPDAFVLPDGRGISTPDPVVRDALRRLSQAYPASVPFDDLVRAAGGTGSGGGSGGSGVGSPPAPSADDAARRLANALLGMLVRSAAEFFATPPAFTLHPGDRPVASPLARLQASRGEGRVTTLRHEMRELPASRRNLIALLNGNVSRAELPRRLGRPEAEVEAFLREIAQNALLRA